MAKKKIKDMTFGEAKEFCKRHWKCHGCPAALGAYCRFDNWDEHLEDELEVKE